MIMARRLNPVMWWGGSWFLLLSLVSAQVLAAAEKSKPTLTPTTQPAVAASVQTSVSSWESVGIGRSSKTTRNRPAPAGSASSSYSLWRVIGSLALVLLLIFVVRWLGRHFLGLSSVRDSSGVIQVLCKSVLSPKQRLLLVQVGRRVVLVADCGSQMNALCEITDPEEIAALAGQIQQRKADSSTNAFLSLMGHASKQFEDAERLPQEPADSAPAGQDADPQLNGMREELNGLMEKVRGLSHHFRRD
jgi:flagellar biogenesis protein FliO